MLGTKKKLRQPKSELESNLTEECKIRQTPKRTRKMYVNFLFIFEVEKRVAKNKIRNFLKFCPR